MLCPYYPLMDSKEEEKSYGQTLYSYVDDILDWITSGNLMSRICESFPALSAPAEKGYIDLLSGESAGGHLAAYCWASPKRPRIKTLYLQSMMSGGYHKKPGQEYMGRKISLSDTRQLVTQLLISIIQKGTTNARVGDNPPNGMGSAYLLSSVSVPVCINGKRKELVSAWELLMQNEDLFQQLQIPRERKIYEDEVILDPREIVTLLEDPTSQLECFGITYLDELNAFGYKQTTSNLDLPTSAPDTIIIHGDKDTSCPVEDAIAWRGWMKGSYPQTQVELFMAPGKGHAWAYNQDDDWIKGVAKRVRDSMLRQM